MQANSQHNYFSFIRHSEPGNGGKERTKPQKIEYLKYEKSFIDVSQFLKSFILVKYKK